MQIVFGKYFDNGYYLDYSRPGNQNIFNKLFIGPMGLLGLLERDLGLSGTFLTFLERKVRYRVILAHFLSEHPGNLFEDSFEIDPEGVTSELLRYRDQLVFAGWNSEINGISGKIDLLAQIEATPNIPVGPEDRWIKAVEAIQRNENVSFGFSRILLNEPVEELHPFFRRLFPLLHEKGIEVINLPHNYFLESHSNLCEIKKKIIDNNHEVHFDPNDTRSLQVLRFKSDADATEFLASQWQTIKASVVVNRDNRLFDEMLNSFGHPVSGSEQVNTNPSLIQLFRLVTVLLVKPLNINHLLSYLQVEVNPIPVSLRYKLMKVLRDDGGMNNPDWEHAIEDFEYNNDEARERAHNFLTIRHFPDDNIDRNVASQLFHSLEQWAQERIILGDNTNAITAQLAYLIDLCRAIREVLFNNPQDTLTNEEMLLMVNGIYEPRSFINYSPQVGSCRVVACPGQIVDHPDLLVWIDFYNEEMKPLYYDFLNSDECNNLAANDIQIWQIQEQVTSRMEMLLKGLLIPQKKCILIVVDKTGDKPVTDHPVHSWLKATLADVERITIEVNSNDPDLLEFIGWAQPEIVENNTVKLPVKLDTHLIESGELIPQRVTESSSSIELLIQNPFDWVLQYAARIQPGNSYQLDDLFTTQGTVAHKFIEVLFKDSNNNTEQAMVLMDNFNDRLQSVIEGYGMILLLDENRFEYEVYKERLRLSVLNLIELLEVNQLSVLGTEQEVTVSIPLLDNQEVLGKIDLVLSLNNGHRAIFDLKWSRRPNKFYTLLKENRHIQLAIYKELLVAADEAEVDFVAYYSLSDSRLFSTRNLNGNYITFIDPTATTEEILIQVQASLNFRRNQLTNGIVEEAGGSDLDGLDYYDHQEDNNLFPLETEYGKPGKKKINQYSQFKTFKGEII